MKHSILKLSALFTLVLLLLASATVQAQPKRAFILQTPKNYFQPVGNNAMGIQEKQKSAGGKHDWVVSSDRDNNLVYNSPNGEPNGKTINFMENFYVIKETATHLELIKYDPTVTSNNNSRKVNMKKADYYGWVPRENLLLWRNSLVNPQTNFGIKGLVVHSVARYTQGVGGEQQLVLYNSPTLEKAAQNQNDIRLFEFLYIFDKKDDNYLVGVAQKLPRSIVASQKVVKGWISGKNIRIWAQRLCIEPNSDAEAANERRMKGIKVSLFNTYQSAEELKTGKPATYAQKVLWNDDQYEKGYPPSQKRMPIIAKGDQGIYRTGVITDVFNKNNTKVLSAEEHAILDAEYNTIRDKKQNINMVFVIDGTKSNHPFFFPITNAIDNSLNLLESTSKEYKVATYIYGKSGDGVLASHPLTSSHSKVIKVLENYKNKQDIAQDNNDPTDMYEGIKKALRTLDKKETNIIVLIGDAGNTLNASSFDIVQKMKEKECGLIAFQTRNISGLKGRIYNDFVTQTQKIIQESSRRSTINPTLYPPEEGNRTYRLRYPVESTLPGSLVYSGKDSPMSQAKLEEEIRQMLKLFEEQHEALLRDLDCKIYVDCKPGINEAVLEYILKEIPDIDLRKIRDMDYQLFVEAYTPFNVDKLEYPLYKHVLFLTDRELYDLERQLQRFRPEDIPPSELRTGIINSYKEVLIKHFGSDVATVANKTLGEIMFAVTDLESTSDLLNDHTLKDLEDNRKVSDDEIMEINFYIDRKLEAMKKVIGNPSYFFRSRDNTYYWVPQEVIP